MTLEIMPQSIHLEKILQEKQNRFNELQKKLSVLQSPSSEVAVSYSLDLNLTEQIDYAKKGLYSLYRDLNGYSEYYKNDVESDEPSL